MVQASEREHSVNKNAPCGNPPATGSAQVPKPRANPLPGCPMAAAFAAVGGKWKLTLIYWLAHDECHFAGLRRRAAPIAPKVLAEQLRELEADGLVERIETGPVPAPVIYRLTAYGATVLPVVEAVRVWGEAHLARIHRPAASDDRMACATPVPDVA